jgi:acyl carrier protein
MSLTENAAAKKAPFAKSRRPAATTHTAEALQAWLVERLAAHLAVPTTEIDVRQSFASYGLGSMSAVRLSGELEAHLGREISPTLTWDYPTIEAVAKHLASEA